MELPVSGINEARSRVTATIQTLADLGKLIRQYRRGLEMTLDQLAGATGISKPYLSNIENGRLVGPPSAEKLGLIENALAIHAGELVRQADWLRTPETIRQLVPGSPSAMLPRHDNGSVDLDRLLRDEEFSAAARRTTVAQTQDLLNTADLFPALVNIPLINRVAAGSPTEYTDMDYPSGIADAYIPAPAQYSQGSEPDQPAHGTPPDAGMFALRVEGDSMSPQYLPGDIIVLSTVDTPTDGDDCLVRLDERGNFATTFKRIYFVDADGKPAAEGSHVQLRPLNPRHAQRLVVREHITGLYPAVWKITPTPRRAAAVQQDACGMNADAPNNSAKARRTRRGTAGHASTL